MPRRTGNLHDKIVDRDNLRIAFLKASKGKRDRYSVRNYSADLDANLERLQTTLADRTVTLGRYQQFLIRDPKERVITAPCFEERVLHHAIMNVCDPYFERRLIFDTYACRVGKGRNKAVTRARKFAGSHRFFLQLDFRRYFDSIPHDRLMDALTRLFKDRRLLELFSRIIRAFRGSLGTGLPIGSLTSQHLANFYLNPVDRLIKETLRFKGYVRYMDDLVVWGTDSRTMQDACHQIRSFADRKLGLTLKPNHVINRTSRGMDFLGCRIWPTHVTLSRKSRARYRHMIKTLHAQHHTGALDSAEFQRRATSLTAFTVAAGAKSFRFRRSVIDDIDNHV